MRAVERITGTMAPLPRANIDTDQIIPKQFLKRIERTGYGEFLFWDWRRTADGELDPDFVLNKPEYASAPVLVTGPNFGSGSSREHAPWSLEGWGFEAIIAPSFAEIFFTNCTKVGLLPVVLTEKEVQYLLDLAAEDPKAIVTIDLADLVVEAPGLTAEFELDPFVRRRMREGLDDIGITLQQADLIDAFESRRPSHRPRAR
ncbi:MAG: 3-isopropylmalate dehydratase small subunit [Acidimicrobiia bacterium]|nr:3-isopropylmalate dehydratase small subunit [Acidimicrobiia bacterium]